MVFGEVVIQEEPKMKGPLGMMYQEPHGFFQCMRKLFLGDSEADAASTASGREM